MEEKKERKKAEKGGGDDGESRVSTGSSGNIFRHADATDFFLMAFGCLGSVGVGLIPMLGIIYSHSFNDFGSSSTIASTTFIHDLKHSTFLLSCAAMAAFVLAFAEGYCWTKTGERQTSRMRIRYLSAVLQQDVTFFDVKMASASEVVNDISNSSILIQDFIAEKLPNMIMNCTSFVTGYTTAFILTWRVALVALPSALLLVVPGLIYSQVMLSQTRRMHAESNKSAAIAEQSLSSVRTVYAFGAESRTAAAFSSSLDKSVHIGLQQGLAKGLFFGCNAIPFAIWAFMIWYNARLGPAAGQGYRGGTVYAAGISIVNAGMALGAGFSNGKCLGEAASAAERINEVIERGSAGEREEGVELEEVKGEVEFRQVRFAYPTRPESEVVSGFSLVVPAGSTVALVGGSGSGKSTMISLLQRFYEPSAGEIMVDGVDIRRLSVKWLRGLMGLVSQEPALFATSIKDNILFGKEDATMDEVMMAAKVAHASKFISLLPDGYDTQVGEGGVQLSGGQKQRIAIARAIIRSPKILLLDEATSALDSESELIVQEAFEVATTDRTTIVIAHRLSTIRSANTIALIQDGKVIESGSHDDLISNINGHYHSFINHQKSHQVLDPIDNNYDVAANASSPFIAQTHNIRTAHSTNLSSILSQSLEHLSFSSSNWSIVLEEDVQHQKKSEVPSFFRLLMLNLPEWRQAIFGWTGALLTGAINPIYGYLVGTVVQIFFVKDQNEMRQKAKMFSMLMAALALLCFIFNLIQHYNTAKMGEYLTKRIRESTFSKMLSFEVGWFDQDENNTGALCSRLANDATIVRSLVGDRMSLIIQTTSAVTIAVTISLLIAWRFSLLLILLQPIVIFAIYLRFIILKKISKISFNSQLQAAKLAAEAIHNFRTVKSFSSQTHILKLFHSADQISRRQTVRLSFLAGACLGTAQCITVLNAAFTLAYGGFLVSRHKITSKEFFQTMPVIVSTGRLIAETAALTSDISKGANTISSIFSILNRSSLINPENPEGLSVKNLNGRIELVNITMAYPSRPDLAILKRFSLSIEPGHSTALVGASGSGKSTIISLIERFYDPSQGTIFIDGEDIKSYDVRSLRRRISLVGQEPVLFAGTIEDNIAYGIEEEGRRGGAEIEAAARAANAHDFICGLPEGYRTMCGGRGVKLSGGQKQRIAIARAVMRDPKILLMDEATSALDVRAEMAVQEALERVMVGRTTVVVAHRLSAVKNCDVIAVVDRGVLVEKGTHDTLMKKGGKYYGLFGIQNGVKNVKVS